MDILDIFGHFWTFLLKPPQPLMKLFFFKFEDMSSFCEAVDTAGLDSVTHFFGYVQWIP